MSMSAKNTRALLGLVRTLTVTECASAGVSNDDFTAEWLNSSDTLKLTVKQGCTDDFAQDTETDWLQCSLAANVPYTVVFDLRNPLQPQAAPSLSWFARVRPYQVRPEVMWAECWRQRCAPFPCMRTRQSSRYTCDAARAVLTHGHPCGSPMRSKTRGAMPRCSLHS